MKSDKKSLKRITRPIFDDIKLFEEEFKNALHSEVRLINMIGKYIIHHKGKLIRPILTILSSRVCGQPTLNSYKAAAMIELLHIATLIHDDVVDEAEKRRGFPSINRVWKNKIAVLMGDFILSKTLINMVGLKDFAALQLIADTAEKLAAGEILQIEKSLTRSMTEDVYYEMIYQKTASLVSTCCELGAITSTGKDKDRMAMINYGTKLGMAFQVKDDLFDILGSEKSTGKKIGTNIRDAAGKKARQVGNRVKKELNMAKGAAKDAAVEASKKIENKVKQGINQGKKSFSKFKQDSTPASQQTIDVKAERVPEKQPSKELSGSKTPKQLSGSKTPKQLSGSSPKQLALPAAGQSSGSKSKEGSSVRPATRGEARRAINKVFRNRKSVGATRNKPVVKKFQRSAAAKSAANIASKEAKTASAAIDPSQKTFASRKRMGESYSYWREEFIWETDKKYPDKIKEIKPMSGKNTITINPEDESSKYKRGY